VLSQTPDNVLLAMDESILWINDGPRFAYSHKGTPAIQRRSRIRGTQITLALCLSKLPKNGSSVGCNAIYDKSMTTDKFMHFLDLVGQATIDCLDENGKYSMILDYGSFHG
jgi:hypothetical protein